MIAIPNMSKPKSCGECDLWSNCFYPKNPYTEQDDYIAPDCPIIDIVQCKDCKHRPKKDDPDGADYGFNIVAPTDGDELCPCLVEDGWYSWMPEDNFYCGRGERK